MIPIFSARAVNDTAAIRSSIERVLASHHYVLGAEVAAFEREFAAYVGATHCLSLANGTDALELALRAVGVQPGDGVVCAANAGFYGSTALHAIGARPVYADVDAGLMTLTPATVRAALNQGARAVIATHLYGQMAPIEEIVAVAREAGVPVVEDCAQSHGARRAGGQCGTYGDIGCFSFYPTKNLGALGDGGAVVCHDGGLAQKVRQMRQYGWGGKYHVDFQHGRNSRLDEIQAAVLRDKLPHLDAANAQRRAIAATYKREFAGLPMTLPASLDDDYVAHLYVVRLPARDALRHHLTDRGVGCDVHYPVPDHRQKAYGGVAAALPVTEDACATVLTLPCYPGMPAADVQSVVAAVRSFFDR